jgi:hypothetical protein
MHSHAMWVQESGRLHKGHSSVGARPYRLASLPLCKCPLVNFRRFVPSLGFSQRRVWRAAPMVIVCDPWVRACTISRIYRVVWCMLRKVAALTFCFNWCEGCVKACIWRRSACPPWWADGGLSRPWCKCRRGCCWSGCVHDPSWGSRRYRTSFHLRRLFTRQGVVVYNR